MKEFSGKNIDRKELLSKVGSLSQLAHITPFQYTGGTADGVKGFQVSNGTGLDFTVLESKCLDIVNMKYKGMNLNFLPKSGIISPALSDCEGTEFLRCISGGMMYTCGLLNVGAACSADGLDQIFHGRMKTTPAEVVNTSCGWEGNDLKLRIGGEMREAGLFHDNLVLKRSIMTNAGDKHVVITDEIENQGFEEQGLMLLYHINIGYPVLDEGAEFVAPSMGIKTRKGDVSAEGMDAWNEITEPVQGFTEQVFVHKMAGDESGETCAAVINEKLELGVYVKYNKKMLPNLIEWKSMRAGDYAFGIEPSTSLCSGRAYEKENGALKKIAPFETLVFKLEIGVLEGPDEIKDFKDRVSGLKG